MIKKILNILVVLSFLNFGLQAQDEMNITDLDLDNLEMLELADTSEKTSIKEQFAMLSQVMQTMTFKEKVEFISSILSDQINKQKKEITKLIVLSAITGISIYIYKKKDNK